VKTLTSRATGLKDADATQIVWLVEIDADAPAADPTTKYYGSRKYTIDGKTYADDLSPGGLQIGWQKIRRGGGLTSVSSARVVLRNEEKATSLAESYFLENDDARFYVLFLNGSEEFADRIPLGQYVIENYPYTERTWTLELIDGSDKDYRSIPAHFVNLTDYVGAPFDTIGKVVPVPFGKFDKAPNDLSGDPTFIAPCVNTDKFLQKYTSGARNNAYSGLYQYYPSARKWAECLQVAQSGHQATISDVTRQMLLSPTRPKASNTHPSPQAVFNRQSTWGTTLNTGVHLDLNFGGTGGQLGTLTSLSLVIKEIKANGTFSYIIKHGTTTIASGTSVQDDTSTLVTDFTIDLTSQIATYFATKWDFENVSVELEIASGFKNLYEVYLDLRFDDQESKDLASLPIYQDAEGLEDLTGNMADGAVITSSGAVLENPVHQLEAIYRGKDLLNMPTSKIDLASFDTAAAARTAWKFAFVMDQPVEIEFLNGFAFQAGLHIFKDSEGKWNCAAQDKTTVPTHFFNRDNILVKNPGADPNQWEFDAKLSRTNIRELINEIVFRYALDRATGEYNKMKIATSRYRVTGTGTLDDIEMDIDNNYPFGILTDSSATFQTDGVKAREYSQLYSWMQGDYCYISGDKVYEVYTVLSETQLELVEVGRPYTNPPGTSNNGNADGMTGSVDKTYTLGPNVSGAMTQSKTRYKTEISLGDKFNFQTRRGGFTSDFIYDDDTADEFINHISDWRSQRRLNVEFGTGLNAIDVELGDHVFFDHPFLPFTKRPDEKTTLTSGVDDSTVNFPIAGNIIRVGDFLLIDKEVVKVVARTQTSLNVQVSRGQLGTTAAPHLSSVKVYGLNRVQWEVVGVKPDLAKAQVRLQIQEVPGTYIPVGRVVEEDHPEFLAATQVQQGNAGWVTFPNGYLYEDDIYSQECCVGAENA